MSTPPAAATSPPLQDERPPHFRQSSQRPGPDLPAQAREIPPGDGGAPPMELARHSPFGVYVIDSNFRISYLNEFAYEGAFHNVRPALGRDFSEAMHIIWPEPVARDVIAIFRRTLETGEPYHSADFVNPRGDIGTVEAYEWELHRITLADGSLGVACYYFNSTALRRAQEALRERDSFLTGILGSITDGFYVLGDDWRFKFVNDEIVNRYGRPREQIVGANIWEMFPDVVGSEAHAQLSRAMNERIAVEYEIFYEPWQRWFRATVYPSPGGGLAVYSRDITESHRAQEALRKSEHHLELLSNIVPALISYVDRERRYVTCNDAYTAWFGLRREQIVGREMREVIGEAAWKIVAPNIDKALAGEPVEYEKEAHYKHGPTRWIHAIYTPHRDRSGDVIGVIVLVTDITQRRHAEQREHELSQQALSATAKFQSVFNQSGIFAGIMDLDGYLREVNGLAVDSCGYTREQVLDKLFWETPWWRGSSHAQERIRAAARAAAAGAAFREELSYWLANGTERIVDFAMHPIRDSAGNVIYLHPTGIDVTERKQVEEARRQSVEAERAARAEAERANRAKDHFLAVLSHELRTPLSPVLMSVSAMELDPQLPESLREDMALVRRNVELEARLIDDLLDLSRIAAGKLRLTPQPINLNALVNQVCDIVGPDIDEKGIRLICELAESLPAVVADQARLQQVLWNLLNNAAKFTPGGGEIHVTTSAHDGRVRVDVRDTGIGIEGDVLGRMFDAFEQGEMRLTRQFGGLGLGLAICKRLVELHDGRIWAQSDGPGRGAVFTVELPAAAHKPSGDVSSAPGDGHAAPPLRILLVEDHKSTADVLRRLLTRWGHSVHTAGTIAEALSLPLEPPFDILISDIGLPDGSGCDLVRALKKKADIRAIALSGYGMEDDVRKSHDAGFDDHIVKPPNVVQLQLALSRLARAGRGD